MKKQMPLPLDLEDRERRQRVWRQLPEKGRIELAVLYAKLIARAARITTSPQGKEPGREGNER